MSTPRLVTVLWADLVSSTETVAKLGASAGEAWRQRFLGVMREALAATRGREVQHTGDGLFATFESASDAVACAVALQQRVARASERRDADAPAEARVGIALGEALEDAEGVHGLVVVEASRLCGAAKPRQILASALVATLAGGKTQRFAPIGELALKGLPAPVAASAVAWQSGGPAIPLGARLAEFTRGPFVGRASERAQLDAALAGARAGERRIALVAGEPGIGKTRLTAELAQAAHAAGAVVLDGRCDEDLGAPFQPWAQALAYFAAHAPAEELRALLGDETLALTKLVPELRRRFPDLPPPPAIEAEAERWQLYEAVDALLAAASRAAPIVVLLDDLHWADKPSLLLLRHLARSARPAALLVLGTYRETDIARTHPLAEVLADLRREPRVARVLLRGLVETELGALVAARAESEAPAAFVRALHQETEGNPFFADEVLRHLAEAGVLKRDAGGWRATRPIAELGIPEGVREVVGRRLSRLAPATNEALRAASVLGREFETPVLEAISGSARDVLFDALDEATRTRIVEPLPDQPARFSFCHALIQQTLYEELGSAQRMRLHWRAGEALERRHARELDAHAAAIAHHLAEGVLAGDTGRAADASLRAGERALALAAVEEALAHFERALGLLDQAAVDEPERRYAAWYAVGQARLLAADPTGSLEAYLAAFRVAEEQGWAERMAESVKQAGSYLMSDTAGTKLLAPMERALAAIGPHDSATRARLIQSYAWRANFAAADYDAVDRGRREARAMADRLGDPELIQEFDSHLPVQDMGTPNLDELEARAHIRVDRWFDGRRPMLGGVRLQHLVTLAIARGDRSRAGQALADFERAGERWGSRIIQGWGAAFRSALALADGRLAEAKQISRAVRDVQRDDFGFARLYASQAGAFRLEEGREAALVLALRATLEAAPRWIQYHRAALATGLARIGHRDEAQQELAAYDALSLPQRGWSWPFAMRHLAECCALLGDAARAANLERALVPYAGQFLYLYVGWTVECAADRARGQCLAVLGRLDEAIACYEAGLALEVGFGAAALAARTRYWLARALAQRGGREDAERARTEASAAQGAAAGFGMRSLEADVSALLESLGPARA